MAPPSASWINLKLVLRGWSKWRVAGNWSRGPHRSFCCPPGPWPTDTRSHGSSTRGPILDKIVQARGDSLASDHRRKRQGIVWHRIPILGSMNIRFFGWHTNNAFFGLKTKTTVLRGPFTRGAESSHRAYNDQGQLIGFDLWRITMHDWNRRLVMFEDEYREWWLRWYNPL